MSPNNVSLLKCQEHKQHVTPAPAKLKHFFAQYLLCSNNVMVYFVKHGFQTVAVKVRCDFSVTFSAAVHLAVTSSPPSGVFTYIVNDTWKVKHRVGV
ncbi:hypothetical protein J6590_086273 [Homalodisca vitripennis]|nr:hypothetical protein J6590_086273 [Homalodisca vitripennis]